MTRHGRKKDDPAHCSCWDLTMVGYTHDEYWESDADGNPTGHHPQCEFYERPPLARSRLAQIEQKYSDAEPAYRELMRVETALPRRLSRLGTKFHDVAFSIMAHMPPTPGRATALDHLLSSMRQATGVL